MLYGINGKMNSCSGSLGAKITARKLLSMGIKEEDLYTLTEENAYISEELSTI